MKGSRRAEAITVVAAGIFLASGWGIGAAAQQVEDADVTPEESVGSYFSIVEGCDPTGEPHNQEPPPPPPPPQTCGEICGFEENTDDPTKPFLLPVCKGAPIAEPGWATCDIVVTDGVWTCKLSEEKAQCI